MRARSVMTGLAVVGSLLLAGASPALANTTIGQTGGDPDGCAANDVYIDPGYVVPTGGGTITSFSFASFAENTGQHLDFLVMRPGTGTNYTVVGKTGVVTLAGTGAETFPASIPAQAGDVLGFYLNDPIDSCVRFDTGGNSYAYGVPDPNVGDTVNVDSPESGNLNESASLATTGNAVSSTVVSCSPVSVRVGGSSTCTATVTSHASHPSGTVSFASDGAGSFDSSSCTLVLIGGNQSRCSVHFTPSAPGSQMITGSYSGDSSSAPSSGSASLSVGKASSSTSVSCSPSSAVVGGASTSCTATVTGQAPSGSVAFASNSSGTFTPASSCTLVAVDATHASCSVTYSPRSYGTGTHKIYGTYSGDSNNSTSTGSTTITVT